MGVQRHVATGTEHLLHGHWGNVFIRFRVNKRVSQAEIDQMDHITFVFESNHNVVWFEVSMNVVRPVDVFGAVDQLVEDHESRLEAELFAAKS